MRIPVLLGAVIGALVTPAPTTAQTIAIPAGDYAVDSDHTQLSFTVTHLGISDYTGQLVQPTGTLHLVPGHPEADKVEIVFATDRMVLTTSPKLDAHLKSADFFDAARYPEARFVSTGISVTGTTASIAGTLTLKGVTRPVVLAARFVGAGANPMSKALNIGFAATTTIKRSDFGLGYGVPMVSDEVRIAINAAFAAKQPSSAR